MLNAGLSPRTVFVLWAACHHACNAAFAAVLKYFIAQREKEIESGEARKRFSKAQNAGAAAPGAKPPRAGEGVRVLEGLAASGLRAMRCVPMQPQGAASASSQPCRQRACRAGCRESVRVLALEQACEFVNS